MTDPENRTAVVIGAGPAGLMAADQIAQAGHDVLVLEAKPSVARKFLMAGKSGLNLTKDEALHRLLTHYGRAQNDLSPMLQGFDAQAVQEWARGLGQELFTGSTGRVFPEVMKGSPLLRAWLTRLDALGVERRTQWRWCGWHEGALLFETAKGRRVVQATTTVLALGGASWARLGSDGIWAEILRKQGVDLANFAPSNAAVSREWSEHMRPHFGTALKAVGWSAGDLRSRGEAILSKRGLEGGGVYPLTPALRRGATLYIDLMPDVPLERLTSRLPKDRKKARLSQWLKKTLKLPAVKVALFNEVTASYQSVSFEKWPELVKHLPIQDAKLRPIDEAISTSGGVMFESMNADLMLHKLPSVFCAGEMLDWEAPTGGYLLTGCLATGRWAGQGVARFLA